MRKHNILLFLLTGTLLFVYGGIRFGTILIKPDESLYTEISLSMNARRQFLIPFLQGKPDFVKPPLVYWLELLGFSLFGKALWAARLPVWFLGIGSLFFTYRIGKELFSAKTGLCAGILLLSSLVFFQYSQADMMDVPLTFFLLLSFYAFLRGEKSNPGWLWVCGVGASFIFLTKGPIGNLLLLLLIFEYSLAKRFWKWLQWKETYFAILTGLFLSLLWPLLLAHRGYGLSWWRDFIVEENLGKFHGPVMPVSILLIGLLGGIVPWTFLFLESFGVLILRNKHELDSSRKMGTGIFRRRTGGRAEIKIKRKENSLGTIMKKTFWQCFFHAKNYNPKNQRRIMDSRLRGNDVEEGFEMAPKIFLLLWFAGFLLLFCLPARKLPHYVIPTFPAVFLLIASTESFHPLTLRLTQILLASLGIGWMAGVRLTHSPVLQTLLVLGGISALAGAFLLRNPKQLTKAAFFFCFLLFTLPAVMPGIECRNQVEITTRLLRGKTVGVFCPNDYDWRGFEISPEFVSCKTRGEAKKILEQGGVLIFPEREKEKLKPLPLLIQGSWKVWKTGIGLGSVMRVIRTGNPDGVLTSMEAAVRGHPRGCPQK